MLWVRVADRHDRLEDLLDEIDVGDGGAIDEHASAPQHTSGCRAVLCRNALRLTA
jgi:hypothetical protein